MKIDKVIRQSAYSLGMTVLLLVCLLLINLLFETFDFQFDMSEKGLFTLSSQSIEVINSSSNNIQIYALYKKGQEDLQVLGILDNYKKHKKISLRIIDPDREPMVLAKFLNNDKVLSQGSIIVESGNYWQILNYTDLYVIKNDGEKDVIFSSKIEQKITSAIEFVSKGRVVKLYEVIGHNETLLSNGVIGANLVDNNFAIEELNITKNSGVPMDADILIINDPQSDFSEYEVDKIRNYLDMGGKLFIAIGYLEKNLPNIGRLFNLYNIDIENGLVMERDKNRLYSEFGDNPFFFAPNILDHKIGDYVKKVQNYPFISAAIGFKISSTQKRSFTIKPVLSSSSKSWLRKDLSNSEDNVISSDTPGPITLALTIAEINLDSGLEEGSRIVVFGAPSALSSIGTLGILSGNINFLLGSLLWLDNNDSFIPIGSKFLYSKPLVIDTNSAFIIGGISIILIPFAIIILSIIVYLKRKKL